MNLRFNWLVGLVSVQDLVHQVKARFWLRLFIVAAILDVIALGLLMDDHHRVRTFKVLRGKRFTWLAKVIVEAHLMTVSSCILWLEMSQDVSTYRASVAHAITHAPSTNVTETRVVVQGWQRNDVVAPVFVLDSRRWVALGAQFAGVEGPARQANVWPIIRAKGHMVRVIALHAVNCSIFYALFKLYLGLYYTIDHMTRKFCSCHARVTEVDLLIRSTSVRRILQGNCTFCARRLDEIIFEAIVDSVTDLSVARAIVVLEQQVIFEMTVFFIASLAARKILAVPAVVGITSNREALA